MRERSERPSGEVAIASDWPAWLPSLPGDTAGIGRWTIGLAAAYLLFRTVVVQVRRVDDEGLGAVGDAMSFSVSCLLLLGVCYPRIVLVAIGDTTPFLVFSGLGGIYYAVRMPFKM